MNEYQELFDGQRRLFASGSTRSYEWRVDQLNRMGRLVRENEAALQRAVGQDFKTASQEQVFETLACAAETEYQKSQLKSWMAPVEAPVPRALAATGHKGMIYRDPYGVTLVIGPFNGPLLLLLRPAIAALAAGNTCVLKLSAALKGTSPLLMELVPKYFESDAVSADLGRREQITELLKLPFDFIFFTCSTSTCKVVARAAAENLTPVLLELGGQNPALVDETANIKDAAKKIVWGAMVWGGQWCTSPGYAYVHESVADAFVEEAKSALVSMYGDRPKENPDYSKVISDKEVQRLAGLVDPEKVVAGGEADPEARYLAPTIAYPVTWDDRIMEEEVFGPVLPVLKYKNLDEAFARIAATPSPLAAFIFSRNQATIDRFTRELSYGGGAVNQTNIHLYVESMPFGGVGPSGMGHYYGKYGFDQLTHAKSMLISPADVAIDHLFPPFTNEKTEQLITWFEY
ncbi:MAG: aldehyde dehydrogenase [Ramlibacter sp.]|nr:aldehyde dehydrogenase [Ramlibacter sp.]